MISRSDRHLIARLLSYEQRKTLIWFLLLAIVGFILSSLGRMGIANTPRILEFGWESEALIWATLIPLYIAGSIGLQGIGHIAGSFFLSIAGRRIVHKVRAHLLERLLCKKQEFFDSQSSDSLSSILIYHVEQVYSCIANGIISMIKESLAVAFLLGYLFYLNSWFTFLLLLIVPLAVLIVIYVSRLFYVLSKRIQLSIEEIGKYSMEMLRSIQLIRLFSSADYQSRQFSLTNLNNYKQNLKFILAQLVSSFVLEMIVAVFVAMLVFIVLVQLIGIPFDSLGSFIAYIATVALIGQPIKKLSLVMGVLQKGIAAAERMFGYIDEPGEDIESGIDAGRAKGHIVFENVSMTFADGATALTKVNVEIKPGQMIALVGRSGSGKTTMVNLLLRFYDTSSGRILLDGRDITQLSLKSLRQNFSLVSQNQIFFNDSITRNIAYANEYVDKQRLKLVADMAHVSEFANQLGQGFDSVIGDNGSLLSGGQRQRLSIARALYRDSPILILDEATSALDNESDKLVQDALRNLMQSKTAIVIAHKLSNIERADSIVVLDKGQVVQHGTHKDLVTTAGLYQYLYQHNQDT